MNKRSLFSALAVTLAILANACPARAQMGYGGMGGMPQGMPPGMAQGMGPGGPCGPMGCAPQYAAGGDEACASDCGCGGGCDPGWRLYSEFLYLRARNVGVEYAVPQFTYPDGGPTVQVGRTAVVDSDFHPGYRAGVARTFDDCSSISGTYTHYQAGTGDSVAADDRSLHSMVMLVDSDVGWQSADAHMNLLFDLADVDFHHVFWTCGSNSLSYVVGARYANLEQRFRSSFGFVDQGVPAIDHVQYRHHL